MNFLRDLFVSAAGRYKLVAARTLEVSGLRLSDATDQTKVATFAMSTIGTGTTRTFTFPNATGTFSLTSHTHALDDLSDVTITSAAAGDMLRYDGSAWVNVKPTVLHVPFVLREDPTVASTNFVWTNMPAALTILYGSSGNAYVKRLDLTYAKQARLSFRTGVGGASGAKLLLRYATDASTFTTPSPAIEATFGTSTGEFTSGWVTLDASMQGDVWVAVWGQSGDGAADPRFQGISAEFR